MSILNYFRKIDKVPSDNDEGLKELLGPNVLKEVNAELRRVIDSPEPGCSTSFNVNCTVDLQFGRSDYYSGFTIFACRYDIA